MGKYVKPFTLFLCTLILFFLIVGTKMFLINSNNKKNNNESEEEKPQWTGIITLWDIPYIETGVGSNSPWLNARIEEFERKHPGVFIDVKKMSPQRAGIYFAGQVDQSILPDIISISPYANRESFSLFTDLKMYFEKNQLNRINPLAQKYMLEADNRIISVPYMMGTYALFFNKEMLEKREITLPEVDIDFGGLNDIIQNVSHVEKVKKNDVYYYGFGSYNSPYSRPIISMIYNEKSEVFGDIGYKYLSDWLQKKNMVPEGMGDMDSTAATKLFIEEKRIGVYLGNTRTLYRGRNLESQGKGFDMGISSLPVEGKAGLFTDQIAAYGILKKENDTARNYSIDFLKFLLTDDAQGELKKIGMFPIIDSIGYIYQDDPAMLQLEEGISKFKFCPEDSFWEINQQKFLGILQDGQS